MIKCWIKSLIVTMIVIILEWIIVGLIPSLTVVILTAYLGAIIAEKISLSATIKSNNKKYKKIILSLLLPSNYYLIFVLAITYWIFFTDWSIKLGG